jgi:hypothetical protein
MGCLLGFASPATAQEATPDVYEVRITSPGNQTPLTVGHEVPLAFEVTKNGKKIEADPDLVWWQIRATGVINEAPFLVVDGNKDKDDATRFIPPKKGKLSTDDTTPKNNLLRPTMAGLKAVLPGYKIIVEFAYGPKITKGEADRERFLREQAKRTPQEKEAALQERIVRQNAQTAGQTEDQRKKQEATAKEEAVDHGKGDGVAKISAPKVEIDTTPLSSFAMSFSSGEAPARLLTGTTYSSISINAKDDKGISVNLEEIIYTSSRPDIIVPVLAGNAPVPPAVPSRQEVLLKALKAGTATITATGGGKETSFTVSAVNPTIKLYASKTLIDADEKVVVRAKLLGLKGETISRNSDVQWTSSNKEIAVVEEKIEAAPTATQTPSSAPTGTPMATDATAAPTATVTPVAVAASTATPTATPTATSAPVPAESMGEVWGKGIGTTVITASYLSADGQVIAQDTMPIEVRPAINEVQIDGPTTVVLGQPQNYELRLLDAAGEEITDLRDRKARIDSLNRNVLRITKDAKDLRRFSVNGLLLQNTELQVKINEAEASIPINVVSVSRLVPLRVTYSHIPPQQVAIRYGRQMSEDFIGLRVHLENNLTPKNDADGIAPTVMVSSSSLEARVSLYKRFSGRSHSRFYVDTKGNVITNSSNIDESEIQFENNYPKLGRPEPKTGADKYWHPVLDSELVSNFTRALGTPNNAYPETRILRNQRIRANAIYHIEKGKSISLHLRSDQEFKDDPRTEWKVIQQLDENWKPTAVEVLKAPGTGRFGGLFEGQEKGVAVVTATLDGDIYYAIVSVGQTKPVDGSYSTEGYVLPIPQLEVGQQLLMSFPEAKDGKARTGSWGTYGTAADVVSNTGAVTGLQPGIVAIYGKMEAPEAKEWPDLATVIVIIPRDKRSELPPSVYEDKGRLKYQRHIFVYRPFLDQQILSSLDARNERSPRSRLFRFLASIGTLGSFGTSVNLLRGSSSEVLDSYANLLLPGAERLYPDMHAVQRQNLINDLMKPTEEISYGQKVEKVVFVPRAPFYGLLANYDVRIEEVFSDYHYVEVAVIRRSSVQAVENGESVPIR